MIEQTDSMVRVLIEGKVELELTPSAWTAVYSEWVYWTHHYVEFMPATTQTVLDVGAGCGETALLYFLQGAKCVICVEPEVDRARLLERNSARNHWNTTIIRQEFNARLLDQASFDFMKMDCEGCESQLLRARAVPPCVMEVHGRQLLDALLASFPQLGLAKLQSGAKFDRWVIGSNSRIERSERLEPPQSDAT